MHMAYYSQHHGFGRAFEADLSISLGELMRRIEDPLVEAWAAVEGGTGRIVGTVFVDVLHPRPQGNLAGFEEGGKVGHLRAFIVEEGFRGLGLGRRLLAEAVRFVDEVGYEETRLWTFKGLEAARKLYEEFGFEYVDGEIGDRWGEPVFVQLFSRKSSDCDC